MEGQAVAVPNAAAAGHARALAHLQAGRLAAAEAELAGLLQGLPGWAEGYHLAGLVAQAGGRLVEAQNRLERAIGINPKAANYHANMAVVLLGRGQAELAIGSCLAALKLDKNQFGALMNMGLALAHLDRPSEALAAFEQARALRPDFAPVLGNIGRMENLLGDYEAALAAYRRASELAPHVADHALGQATNLYMLGRTRESLAQLDQVIARWPDNLMALSARTFALNYFAEVTPDQQAAAARAYGAVLAQQVVPQQHRRDPGAVDKVLRVGFVSSDLRQHSVSLFLLALLPRLDRSRLQLVAYSTSRHSDATSEALRLNFAEWVDASVMPLTQLADRIAEDRIDILLDLSGHTLGHRLPVFARKPAPVSASWLGYSGTTGVAAIDYLVCDARVVPPGEEAMIAERPWRLPHSFICEPHNGGAVPVARSDRPGFTFGSFNSHNKLNDATIAVWADILNAVADSRLLLKSRSLASVDEQAATAARFAAHGIDPARLTLLGRTATVADHLALYGEMDIALDPFPYNGTTTTMQALRMGVPVIALQGDRYIGRVGASILGSAGLSDWIAPNRAGYVELARRWANDRAGLAAFRDRLPAQIAASPMADTDRFARDFGAMLTGVWRNWCLGA